MPYRVAFRPQARRDFNRLSREVQTQIKPYIDALAEEARPPGCKKLKGGENLWRIRISDYRIVYQIHDQALIVVVVRIGHWREVYR